MRTFIFLLAFLCSNLSWSNQFQAVFDQYNKIIWPQYPGPDFKVYLCSTKKYWTPQYKSDLQESCDDLFELSYSDESLILADNWSPKILKGALQLIATDDNQILSTRVKVLGVLDDLYFYRGTLGPDWNQSKLKLWAPTANWVRLHIYQSGSSSKSSKTLNMKWQNGVWEIPILKDWKNLFYKFEVNLFDPYSNMTISNMVTDPYSISLSTNSKRSQFIDLSDEDTMPIGWNNYIRSTRAYEDSVIYELHIRDFSMHDNLVANYKRGKYEAFCESSSQGNRHLRRLQKAGLTHVHLLPFFDIATVNEIANEQLNPVINFPLDPASEAPQSEIAISKDKDGFNWGYDPYHYGVVEGSYAINPEGSSRILEARNMIKCLHDQGLNVVMDVVFNHTHRAADDPDAILDKIVPAYYYRTNQDLKPHQSTCCPDTATERPMMLKLMVDSILRFAKHYHIDGFRFDLMGHHTVQNLSSVRKVLDTLPSGSDILLYGEGWAFGSLHDKQGYLPMNQTNAAGTGVGTFNDRMRDAVRGGNYMHSSLPNQGWSNGLLDNFNSENTSTELLDDIKRRKNYEELTDLVRLGISGNLANIKLNSYSQGFISGSQLNYGGQPGAGYALDPQETIQYVSAHDNYTLWDQILAKTPIQAPSLTIFKRVRMQLLALATVSFSQGIPFYHAGSEMLRSKSGDGDSYNAGDYFNRIDFSFKTNNWGVGLPSKEKNFNEWGYWAARLRSNKLKVDHKLIKFSMNEFIKQLEIRKSYKILRQEVGQSIISQLKFLNAEKGKQRIPGLIVAYYDSKKPLVVIFNPLDETIEFLHPIFRKSWELVPQLQNSAMSEGFKLSKKGFSIEGLSYAILEEYE